MTAEQDRTDAKHDYPLICESCGRHLPCRHCDAAEIPDEWVEAAMEALDAPPLWLVQTGHVDREMIEVSLAAVYPLIRAEVEQEFARMISAAKSAEGRVVTAQRERDELAAAVLALADEWERRGHGPVPAHIADEGCQGCRIVAELRAVVGSAGVEAAARVKAQALREAADRMPAFRDRDNPEWAITAACDWLKGRAAALDADTGSAT